ncbi:uncharacterized protein UTRI_06244 [Ustilago trichophora]|uniref:Uncharacterized protein n=1 Tax=Ustilago trichophora TaxID=86804 RepID=A0A5C3EGU4_9BASI|nr:uncharacterized protein UTRI_06244 [Ustilago trichophora]
MKGSGSFSLPLALFSVLSALTSVVGAARMTPAPAPVVIIDWPVLTRENEALLSHIQQKYGFRGAQIENLELDPISHYRLQRQLVEHARLKKFVLLRIDYNNRNMRLAMPVASSHDAQRGNKAVVFFSMEPLDHGRANIYLRGYSKLSNVAGIDEVLRDAQSPTTFYPGAGSVLSKHEALHLLQQWLHGPV